MGRRFKSAPVPPADAQGYVEMRIGGRMVECHWSLRGARLTVNNGVGNFYGEDRDPIKGTVEDQARGMILVLWRRVADRQRGAGRIG